MAKRAGTGTIRIVSPEERAEEARALPARTLTRREKALALRLSGATYEAIGGSLGITKKAAWDHVQRALGEIARQVREQAEVLREEELARLDRMQLAVWNQATGGSLQAIDRVLRIMERRARLLGLDAPVRLAGEAGAPLEVHVRYVDEWQTD